MNIDEWLDESLSYLPLFANEKDLRRELLDHYQDRLEAFLQSDVPWEEAKSRAVACLGNPKETGRLMRQVYRPWVSAVLVLLRIAIVVILLVLPAYSDAVRSALESRVHFHQWMASSTGTRVPEDVVLLADRAGDCGGVEARLGPFRVSLYEARVQLSRYEPENEPLYEDAEQYEWKEMEFVLRFQAPPWYTPDRETLGRNLRLMTADQTLAVADLLNQEEYPRYDLDYLGKSLFASYYKVTLSDFPELDRVSLRYEAPGGSFDFHADFGPWSRRPAMYRQTVEDEAELIALAQELSGFQSQLKEAEKASALSRVGSGRERVSAGALEMTVPWCWEQTADRDPENPKIDGTIYALVILRGPTEELPLCKDDLWKSLEFRAEGGEPEPVSVSMFRRYADAVVCLAELWVTGNSPSYTLRLEGSPPLELKLRMREEQP